MEACSTFVNMDQLLGETAKLQVEGFTYVAVTCVELDGENFELIYHFDRNLEMRHLRLRIPKGIRVPSITRVYPAAFLAENEIQDLFDLRFSGLAIDFNRTLYTEGEMRQRIPFCRYAATAPEAAEQKRQEEETGIEPPAGSQP